MVYISGLVLLALFLLCFYLPVRAYRAWHGRWRYVALIPLLIPVAFVVRVLVGLVQEPPEHRLSPELVVAVILGALFLTGVLHLVYLLVTRRGRD